MEMEEAIAVDLNEFINDSDIEMEDDELVKELKEIEQEEEKCENSLSEITSKENITDVTPSDEKKPSNGKKNHRNRKSSRKTDFKTFCDELDEKERDRTKHHESYDRHSSSRSERGQDRYPNDRHRKRRYEDARIDYARLEKSLHVSRNSDPMIIGREIAYRLHEVKTALFGHMVRILGFTTVSEIFAETKDLMRKGGLKTDNGDRKRTPGGTFIYILKNRGYATPEQVKEIFKEDKKTSNENKKRKTRDTNDTRHTELNEKENITEKATENKAVQSKGDEKDADKADTTEVVTTKPANKSKESNIEVADKAKEGNSALLEEGELSDVESGEITSGSNSELVT